jgi:hypothetical protein
MSVTLSVNEISAQILAAFTQENPELFGPAGFTKDFRSDTARLGDVITAHIAHVPTIQDYQANDGGFRHGAQSVQDLLEDVPVTINRLKHVPVKISYLTNLATKGVDLYKAAVANIGFALGKHVIDTILQNAIATVSHSYQTTLALTSVDSFEALRAQCNAQKMDPNSRFCFMNTPLASALSSDDRTKSKLFYDQRQGDQGFRTFKNIAGFRYLREYTDFPSGSINLAGLAGDSRLACVSVRKIQNMNETADALGIKKVMDFQSLRDADTGLELAFISWQEAGTGDVYLSSAILFGIHTGNAGGAAGTITDNAGCLIQTI